MEELIPSTAWCIQDLLTSEECQDLLQTARKEGIESMKFTGDTRHRQRVTVRLDRTDNASVQNLLDKIWERIKDRIPQEIVIGQESAETNEGLRHVGPSDCIIGKWTPSGLHHTINVAHCTGQGHLAAHRDADIVLGEHQRSFLTVNGFLTSRPVGSGGATRFMRDDIEVAGADILVDAENDVLCRVESDEAGKAVIFFHGLVHDGEPLAQGSPEKWIFRTLVCYQRDPASAPRRTPEQIEARRLLKEAEQNEQSGRIKEAIRLYSRAYRLDPELE